MGIRAAVHLGDPKLSSEPVRLGAFRLNEQHIEFSADRMKGKARLLMRFNGAESGTAPR
jgi:hypothetical protein